MSKPYLTLGYQIAMIRALEGSPLNKTRLAKAIDIDASSLRAGRNDNAALALAKLQSHGLVHKDTKCYRLKVSFKQATDSIIQSYDTSIN